MSGSTNPLESENDNFLHSSLSTAFSPAPRPQAQPTTSSPPQPQTQSPTTPPNTSLGSSSSDDEWKSQYESHVQTWRAQSAEAREKAEKERARWEKIREAERVRPQAEGKWPSATTPHLAQSPADTRDLATGQVLRHSSKNDSAVNTTHAAGKPDRQDTVEKWEEVPSVASSFPSLSFPHSSGTSPDRSPREGASIHVPPPPPVKVPLSATQAIFDPALPTQARVSAFFSSLAINMLLPFVNGVMLGFGEIFAKNVVLGWFGWKTGDTVVTNVGIGVRRPSDRARG